MEEIKKEELQHIEQVIRSSQSALTKKNAARLKELSNQTTHSSCIHQYRGLVTISILNYTLGKMIEREDYAKIKTWNSFVKKYNSHLANAINAIKAKNTKDYDSSISQARKTLESISQIPKEYMKEIIINSCINRGSKFYEHGISLEKTAKLLGITQWDLSGYVGSSKTIDVEQNKTISVSKRAKIALEFFG